MLNIHILNIGLECYITYDLFGLPLISFVKHSIHFYTLDYLDSIFLFSLDNEATKTLNWLNS